MHRAAGIGLQQHQQLRLAHELARLRGRIGGRLLGARGLHNAARRIAQDAKSGIGQRHHGAPLGIAKLVLAIAQKGEIVVAHPGQQGAALGHFLGRQRWRRGFQLRDAVVELGQDRLPVGHGGADIVQHRAKGGFDARQHGRVADLVDLDVHDGFCGGAWVAQAFRHGGAFAPAVADHGDDGVDQGMNGERHAIECGGH